MEKQKQEKTTKQTNLSQEKRFQVVFTDQHERELGVSKPYSEEPSAEFVEEMTQRLVNAYRVEVKAEVVTI